MTPHQMTILARWVCAGVHTLGHVGGCGWLRGQMGGSRGTRTYVSGRSQFHTDMATVDTIDLGRLESRQ